MKKTRPGNFLTFRKTHETKYQGHPGSLKSAPKPKTQNLGKFGPILPKFGGHGLIFWKNDKIPLGNSLTYRKIHKIKYQGHPGSLKSALTIFAKICWNRGAWPFFWKMKKCPPGNILSFRKTQEGPFHIFRTWHQRHKCTLSMQIFMNLLIDIQNLWCKWCDLVYSVRKYIWWALGWIYRIFRNDLVRTVSVPDVTQRKCTYWTPEFGSEILWILKTYGKIIYTSY